MRYAIGLATLGLILSNLTIGSQYAQVPQDCPGGVCPVPVPQGPPSIRVNPPVDGEVIPTPDPVPNLEVPYVPNSNPVIVIPNYPVLSPGVVYSTRQGCGPTLQFQPCQPVRNVVRGVCQVPVRIAQAQPVRSVVRGCCRVVGRAFCR